MVRKLIGLLPTDATDQELQALVTATLKSVKADEAAKRPRDINELGVTIAKIATGENEENEEPAKEPAVKPKRPARQRRTPQGQA